MNKKQLKAAKSLLNGTSRRYRLRDDISITSWPKTLCLSDGGYGVEFQFEKITARGREQGSNNSAIDLQDLVDRFCTEVSI